MFALLLFFPCATFPALVTEAVDLESPTCSTSGIQHEELHVLSRGFRKQRVDRALGGPQTLKEAGSCTLEVSLNPSLKVTGAPLFIQIRPMPSSK